MPCYDPRDDYEERHIEREAAKLSEGLLCEVIKLNGINYLQLPSELIVKLDQWYRAHRKAENYR